MGFAHTVLAEQRVYLESNMGCPAWPATQRALPLDLRLAPGKDPAFPIPLLDHMCLDDAWQTLSVGGTACGREGAACLRHSMSCLRAIYIRDEPSATGIPLVVPCIVTLVTRTFDSQVIAVPKRTDEKAPKWRWGFSCVLQYLAGLRSEGVLLTDFP